MEGRGTPKNFRPALRASILCPHFQIVFDATAYISETIRARNLKFYAHLDGSSTLSGVIFFARRRVRGTCPLTVYLGPVSYL